MLEKINVDVKSQFIPHPMQLFLAGTYDIDEKADFGVFCWINYCWDEELSLMVCMDGDKLTKRNIMERKCFSLNLVTKSMFPFVEEIVKKQGKEKINIFNEILYENGENMFVPILNDCPFQYELQVKDVCSLKGSDIFICKIITAKISKDLLCENGNYDLIKADPLLVSQNDFYNIFLDNKVGEWK